MATVYSTPRRTFQLRTLSCLIGFAALTTLASQASAADVPCFLNGYATGEFVWQLNSPSQGAEYVVAPGGSATVKVAGAAQLVTNFDWFGSKECIAYWYSPNVWLEINGNQSLALADGIYKTQFTEAFTLRAGTYSLRMKGKYQLAAMNSQPIISYSQPIQITVREQKASPTIVGQLVALSKNPYSNKVLTGGWACLQESAQPINVAFYAGRPYPDGTFLTSMPASYTVLPLRNMDSYDAIMKQCGRNDTRVGFDAEVTHWQSQYAGQPVYAHGVYPDGSVSGPLRGSGITIPTP